MTNSITPLFLAQSYQDAYDDYKRSLIKDNFAHWDYIILTASNEHQAEGFRAQLKKREDILPATTHFAVIPDPDGKRVGSGGATLGVIRYIADREGTSDFSGLRILVIHSGGDSKRVPQYSALGKLFSPVPHELEDGRVSTLFDEFMIGMASVPSRIREGMLLLSGDVLLLFNPLLIDYSGDGAAAISFKENVETGKNHGVFLRGEDGCVKKFLHKQTVETLKEQGAVNKNDCVDIDTGAVVFSSDMLKALYSLISIDGKTDVDLFDRYVNEKVRLSLYGDFLYPLATESTLEQFYKEKPEGELCDELIEARTKVWNILSAYNLKLLRLAPAKFIHFGTSKEIMHLMSDDIMEYSYLGWNKKVNSSIPCEDVAGYNSILSSKAECGKDCYLEVSYVHSKAKIGDNVLLSYVDIEDEIIPSNVVLHGLKQRDGKFVVRIYGVGENPKGVLEDDAMFLGKPITALLVNNGIRVEELWDSDEHSIWSANLYPECDTIGEAVKSALNIYNLANGNGDIDKWRLSERKSLKSGFNDADPDALIAWELRMQELVHMDKIGEMIRNNVPAKDAKNVLQSDHLTKIQEEWLEKHIKKATPSEMVRLYYYIGCALGGKLGDKCIAHAFKCISNVILEGSLSSLEMRKDCHMIGDSHTVKLPLRVNWGGGWSDTPPYCNENGGTVLNAAIKLNGDYPVEVTITKLEEKKVVFDSRDMDTHGEFDTIEPLQRTGDPYDPFALQKAALLACGIIPKEGGKLERILDNLGGGFLMQTEVTGVPKGSGLGTSSILAAACVKSIFEFMGISHNNDDLCEHVLCMEQIMSTGGGWQDQVGGIINGVKYITTMAGLNQKIKIDMVDIPSKAMDELKARFVLIYTGQRRLARNLLRDVVGRYIGNEPNSIYALNEIQKVAALMKFELERGHIDDFAKLMNRHWELSKMVDAGSTNTLIDQIFATIEDLVDGKMICGAGGGGFLQAVLKKGVQKEEVQMKLKEVFQDSDIDVWDCELIK